MKIKTICFKSFVTLSIISCLYWVLRSMNLFHRLNLRGQISILSAFLVFLLSHGENLHQIVDTRVWLSQWFCSTRWKRRRFFTKLSSGSGAANFDRILHGCQSKFCYLKYIRMFLIWQDLGDLSSFLFFSAKSWI